MHASDPLRRSVIVTPELPVLGSRVFARHVEVLDTEGFQVHNLETRWLAHQNRPFRMTNPVEENQR